VQNQPSKDDSLTTGHDRGENGNVPLAGSFIVARIEFLEWTADNRYCHPRLAGIRSDNDAGDVVREGAHISAGGSLASKWRISYNRVASERAESLVEM